MMVQANNRACLVEYRRSRTASFAIAFMREIKTRIPMPTVDGLINDRTRKADLFLLCFWMVNERGHACHRRLAGERRRYRRSTAYNRLNLKYCHIPLPILVDYF